MILSVSAQLCRGWPKDEKSGSLCRFVYQEGVFCCKKELEKGATLGPATSRLQPTGGKQNWSVWTETDTASWSRCATSGHQNRALEEDNLWINTKQESRSCLAGPWSSSSSLAHPGTWEVAESENRLVRSVWVCLSRSKQDNRKPN